MYDQLVRTRLYVCVRIPNTCALTSVRTSLQQIPTVELSRIHTAVGGKKNVASRRRLMESVFVRTGKLVVSLHNLRFARWCKQPLRPKTDALQKFELPGSSNFCNSSKQKYLPLSLPLHIPAKLHEYFMEPAKCFHNG